MLDVCSAARVQFMDGVMFMHSRRLPLLRQVLDDPQMIGTVLRAASHFSFMGSEDFWKQNIRVNDELEPLGCLGDLGWYNIRFSLWVMNERLPERVTGRILAEHVRKEVPVPVEFSGELFFAGGASASFYCSFRTAIQQTAIVSGTQGYLVVRDFVLPFQGSEIGFEVNRPEFRVHGCDFNMESSLREFTVQEHSNSAADAQEASMIRAFAEIVRSGQVEPQWGEIALKTQRVLDACLISGHDGGRPKTIAGI